MKKELEIPSYGNSGRKLLVAIFDKKANEILGSPVAVRTQGEAVRMFTDLVNTSHSEGNRGDSVVVMHPEDFCLVQLGSFDSQSCDVHGLYKVLIEGLEVLQSKGM